MLRATVLGVAALLLALPALAQEKDSPLVAATKKKLAKQVTFEWKETRLKEILQELEEEVEVKFYLDTAGGVSQNQTLSYKAKDEPVTKVLDGLFKGKGLGYIVHKKKGASDRYEGWVQIVQGDNRGAETPPKK